MTDTKRFHVFLCHASEDKPAVRKFYDRLRKDGIDAWLDEEKLLPGQNWQVEISKAVKNSDAFILFLSSNSVKKSGFVQKEINLALNVAQEKPEGTIFFIPARLDQSAVPDLLREYQWVNLFDDKGYEKIRQALQTQIDLPEIESHTNSDTNTKLAQVTIIIERDILKFTDKEKDGFVYAISKLTGVSSNQIRVLQVLEGSVIITLELPEIGAKRLMELYYANNAEIEKLCISKVTIKLENEINHASNDFKKDIIGNPQKSDSNQDTHLQKLKTIYIERLQILELQSAKFGLSVPSHIPLEIEEIKEKISQLNSQIQTISSTIHQENDKKTQTEKLTQINVNGNVSESTIIIGDRNEVRNSKEGTISKEDELARNLNLKRRIESDFSDWLNYLPENRKRNSKMILRAFDSKQYPDSNEPDKFGEYSWFGAEIKSMYHSGIEFIYGIEELTIFDDGKWDFSKNTKDENLVKITTYRVGQINFSDIVDYDFKGDEHYPSPHFFCKFVHKGLPFEATYFKNVDEKPPYYFEFKDKKS